MKLTLDKTNRLFYRYFFIFTLLPWIAGCAFGGGFFSSLNPFSTSQFQPSPLREFKASIAPRLQWAVKVGQSPSAQLMPAVADGQVFVANEMGVLASYDANSGQLLWRRDLKGKVSAGVAVTNGVIVVVLEKGQILALDEDGQQVWTAQASTEVITAPVASLGIVLVRSTDGRVTAYDARQGRRLWSFQRQLPSLTLRGSEPMTIDQGVVYFGYSGGKLVALNLNSGVLRWEALVSLPKGATEIERISDVTGAPIVSLRQVCVGGFQGRVGCFDRQNGEPSWTKEFSTAVGVSADDRYVIGFNEKGEMQAFSRDGGAVVWRNEDYLFRKPQAPMIYGRAAIFTDIEGYVHWVSRDDGKPLARLRLDGGQVTGPIAMAERTMYVQTRNGYLSAIDLD